MKNDSSAPSVIPAEDVRAGVLGAPPTPMSTNEIVWSRKYAMRDVDYRDFSEAQQHALLESIMKYGAAIRYHAIFARESGEPAGSGVCVTSGGRRGILTARHVLDAGGEGGKPLFDPLVGFAPPQSEMMQDQRRRQHGPRNSRKPIGPFQVTGISIGDRVTFVPLQRREKACPDPRLPDIAIVVVSDDIEERLRKAAHGEGTAVPEPRWLDLDSGDLVSVPYGLRVENDEMLRGSWLITGLRGERSNVKKFYSEMDGIVIDRIYRRSEWEYYGIFVDEVGGRREGAALLRWRPNQSLRRRRGRRQLDPSRRGEERRRVRWPTVLLSSATDGGLPLVLARFVRGLSTHQGSGCPRRLRTSATAAQCHRGPVDSHRVADQMPTGPSMSRRRAPHAASPLPRG